MRVHKYFLTILLIFSITIVSCGPKTKTITPLSQSDKSNIKNLAINVQADEELKVSISKMKSKWYDGASGDGVILLLPVLLVAMIVEETKSSNIDSEHSDKFEENLSSIEMDKLLSENIDEYFDTADTGFKADITSVENTSLLAQEGYDTLLDITIDKLEVKLCPKPYIAGVSYPQEKSAGPLSSDVLKELNTIEMWNEIIKEHYMRFVENQKQYLMRGENSSSLWVDYEKVIEKDEQLKELRPHIAKFRGVDSVRFWIKFKGQMISTSSNRVIWDREELYYDPKCEYVEDMQSNPELVVNMLTRAIGDIAVNVVNEIQ